MTNFNADRDDADRYDSDRDDAGGGDGGRNNAVRKDQAGLRVGEVMESHSERVVVECYDLHQSPPLGTLLRIGSPPVYGVVREIWNGPVDPGRPLTPRGAALETEDEVYSTNPQLTAVLTTRLTAMVVGYREGSAIRQGLPPRPPNLHSFAFISGDDEGAEFVREFRFLPLLLADHSPAADQALIAFVRRSAGGFGDKSEFLLRVGRALASELSRDGMRLQTLLREMA